MKRLFSAYCVNRINIENLEKATLYKVQQSVAEADLIHFTCHGHTTPRHCLQLGDDRSGIHCLTLIDLNELPHISESVVFANACSAGATTSSFGKLRSFGWGFFAKGAVNFIGPLGLVPTVFAVTFAEQFYGRLFEGYTVGAALFYAKSNAKRENPFWLFYTLYGDPFTRKFEGTFLENSINTT